MQGMVLAEPDADGYPCPRGLHVRSPERIGTEIPSAERPLLTHASALT